MVRASSAIWLITLVSACGLLDSHPPPVPEGFPQLDTLTDSAAELVIDGENYVVDSGGRMQFDESGFESELHASLALDDLRLEFRGVEHGDYVVADGDLTAVYWGAKADDSCGGGTFTILGSKRYDAGLAESEEVVWGSIQLNLCSDNVDPDVDTASEITGRYAALRSD